jgi:hypothetical protein
MSEKAPDANEILRKHGVDALRDKIDQAVTEPENLIRISDRSSGAKARKPIFQLTAFEDIKLDTEQRDYLVKGLLPDSGLGVIWGPPKCYKSFAAVDVALHIALERCYRGRRVKQANVVYIALEGRKGLPARIEAFKKHHGVDRAPFYLIEPEETGRCAHRRHQGAA